MSLLNQNSKMQGKFTTRNFRDNTDFSKIGGLGSHLKTLRDIIIFPLLHGNVFQYFNIRSPRGVLFYGPPGTGKTLVAGALANELNREGVGRVNFYQRKGADVLDKWVGESEKKLRELFDKATKNRPSIIFFDEIDGLAPIRSQKNDHIHSSIVATLLALMDGLDNKPGVIVIGATNRIETIDPALRRPGRFDKEMYFPLPTMEARKEIIQVHTATWKFKPSQQFLTHIAQATAGFCGSDLAALCTEAVMFCMKRVYPNIECCGNKIKIEMDSLRVEDCDFIDARQMVLPSSVKLGSKMRCLNTVIQPLMQRQLDNVMKHIKLLWPHFFNENYRYVIGEERYAGRLLIMGSNNDGLTTHLVPAIIQTFEHLPFQILDLPTLTDRDVKLQMNFPSMIILSRIDEWWNFLDECEQVTVLASLEDIHAGLPILTIATCRKEIPVKLHDFFYNNSSFVARIGHPNIEEKERFFTPLFFDSKVLSVFGVREEKKLPPRKALKYEFDMRKLRSTRYRTRQCKKFKFTTAKRKREMADNEAIVSKRIKLCENSYCVRGNSLETVSRAVIDHNIKKEYVVHEAAPRKSFYKKSRDHFTTLLTDLLYQRSKEPEVEKTPEAGDTETFFPLKIEPHDDISKASLHGDADDKNDPKLQLIYAMWKRISRVTSVNMTISELELLYDIVSACINMYRYSFDKLIEKIQETLSRIEQT